MKLLLIPKVPGKQPVFQKVVLLLEHLLVRGILPEVLGPELDEGRASPLRCLVGRPKGVASLNFRNVREAIDFVYLQRPRNLEFSRTVVFEGSGQNPDEVDVPLVVARRDELARYEVGVRFVMQHRLLFPNPPHLPSCGSCGHQFEIASEHKYEPLYKKHLPRDCPACSLENDYSDYLVKEVVTLGGSQPREWNMPLVYRFAVFFEVDGEGQPEFSDSGFSKRIGDMLELEMISAPDLQDWKDDE
ncbi:MAG: hypothetical protein NUW37_02295 [Planctomycetes bacterium]|nr:hypothetical protein [Planctomycetota bacterium]